MRTVSDIYKDISYVHDWQTKELAPIDNLSEVVRYLLDEKFVVEIDGHRYDISFGYNEDGNCISFGWSGAPSPNLQSSEIVDRAFRRGKWFLVKED